MEAFGRVHPSQRHYGQWAQMSDRERDLHRRDVAELHIAVARRFEHAGIQYHARRLGWSEEDTRLSMECARELSGMEFLMMVHDDATYSLPTGDSMTDFAVKLAEQPAEMKDEAQRRVDEALDRARRIKTWDVADGICMCSDYCFNDNPFLSPSMFDEFVTPYLQQLVAGYREMGFYVIKHTDGNIMPILESLVSAEPHALHSIDPQGGVDLAECITRG